jgi:electron transfer flavoprotein beta subunit
VKIGVLLKQVPDTATGIKVKSDASGIDEGEIKKWIVNPYDEFAVEAALQAKEALSAEEIIVFNVGPARSPSVFDNPLAMGADRGVGLDDPAVEGAGPLGMARALAAMVKAEGVELVFAGARGVDDDMFAVPVMTAELLEWPAVNVVGQLEIDGGAKTATCHRKIAGGAQEVVEVSLPALITCDWKMNEPRYPNLMGIRKAKNKPRDMKTLADLGLDAAQLAAGFSTGDWATPPERGACKMIEGDAAQAAKELVKALREEAKVL